MASQQQSEQGSQPSLCAAACGFYSNSGPGGLCSKCLRDAQAREQQNKALDTTVSTGSKSLLASQSLQTPPVAVPIPQPSSSLLSIQPVTEATASCETTPAVGEKKEEKKVSTTRCLVCNKKVGLTGFSCKCNPEAVFCSNHRYAEAHACTFDYKAAQKERLAENNPLVMASKLNKF